MSWNWQLPDWPVFKYDSSRVRRQEKKFFLEAGSAIASLKNIDERERDQFIIEILSTEGVESSRIEGEYLDRESLQSSIKQQFGLPTSVKKNSDSEMKMAKLLCDVYRTFAEPLTHEMLWSWHASLFDSSSRIDDVGRYRSHAEPMQIVSSRLGVEKVFFEAPPSKRVHEVMTQFIRWFNSLEKHHSVLSRAAVAHVYFESIHPFEDGNGRIGRLLVEKILSQEIGRPILIAVSKVLESQKKQYYTALEKCNRTLEIDEWIEFFSKAILQAQEESIRLLFFLINKAKILTALKGEINERQEKVLLKMFAEGPKGFDGGLSAEKYISMTHSSRATATRDLVDLVEKGALLKTGELRHTRYWLNLNF